MSFNESNTVAPGRSDMGTVSNPPAVSMATNPGKHQIQP
jgi:hypothetical protein